MKFKTLWQIEYITNNGIINIYLVAENNIDNAISVFESIYKKEPNKELYGLETNRIKIQSIKVLGGCYYE